jgi:hypothetical protein
MSRLFGTNWDASDLEDEDIANVEEPEIGDDY